MTPTDWIEHRRGDGERIGWMRASGDGFVAIDLLGREITGEVDWLTAEETLDARGIGYLADPYLLAMGDGSQLRVRIVEVSTERIRVKDEDYGDITASWEVRELPWPIPPTLTVLANPDA